MKKYLLFDLDGTLTDPKKGICTCVQYALASFGIEEPDLDKLEPFIGPPLKDSFMEFYHMDEKQAEKAVEKYRERFQDTGIFENKVYRGIPKMLRELRARGMVLAVASSKPTVFVQKILEHFHIAGYFNVVVGSELDGRRTKKDEVVAEALRQLFRGGKVEKDKVYMIGDRCFDVEGAHAAGVESVGVTYGYGSMEEMKRAKSDYIVRSVEELRQFLLRGTGDIDGISTARRVWLLLFPALMFFLVRDIAAELLALLLGAVGNGTAEGGFLFIRDGDGVVRGLTGNAGALVSAFGFAAAAGAVWGMARRAIDSLWEDRKLFHLKSEPASGYLFLWLASSGLALGMNLLLQLLQVTARSEAYQSVAENQYSAWLPVGLVCYGIISPVAEELLFRGILYGNMRRFTKPATAAVFSAALFGIYHGNIVQGIYAFVIGYFLAYAYEYFGDFRVPAAIHMAVNLLVYGLSYMGVGNSAFVSWPVCIVCLLCGAGSLWMMRRRRRNVML